MKVYRANTELIDVVIDNKTQLKKSILNEDFIQSSFIMATYFDFNIGDYVLWRGKQYTILEQPSVKKIQANQFQYNIDFKSDQYRFQNALYLFDGQSEFNLHGNFETFANLIITNMNRIAVANNYQLGELPDTDSKNISFSNFTCLYVIQFICKEFGKEFYFSEDGRTLNFVDKVGNDTGLFFEFKSGLRNIERQKVTEKNLVTRLYAFGGARNITNEYGGVDYTGSRLRLPNAPHYLESNTNIFGVIEGVVNFDEIYPKRTGVVSEIVSDDMFKFIDSSMDFDLNAHLIEGVTAKLTFNTGRLAGYEFEISQYTHSSHRFSIIQYQDTNGYAFPSENFKIEVGDEYVLHDIEMPQVYIDNAEANLLEKATEYLEENSMPNVIYNIVPDYPYLRKNLIRIEVGDIITVRDQEFGIEIQTRVLSLTQSIANEYLYTIKVGDKVTVTYLNSIIASTEENSNNITIERFDRTVQYNRIRRNLQNIDELRDTIFDPDGYFDAYNIRPLSIETNMLTVGSKGQQFIIRNLLIEANFQANPDMVRCGDGVLVHFTINPDEAQEWNLSGDIFDLTEPNEPYYIYAKCSKTTNTGVFEITTTQYSTDEVDYYYFLIGVIHSVIDDVRGVSLTYGQTTINGKFITTGRVQSIDGYNFFDLDTGQFNIGNETSGLDWNVTEQDKLTLRGALIQTDEGGLLPVEDSFEVQYSINGSDWHTDFRVNDIYMRQRSWGGTWSNPIRIVGEDGEKGNYTDYIFRRSNSQPSTPTGTNPSGWADSPPSGITHLWMSKADKNAEGALIGSWSTPVRLTGENGQNGNDGAGLVYRGVFSSSRVYYNNTNRRDVVKYNGVYYIYRGTNGIALAWSSANWENFGAQFESVATNLLLAENANIADWIIRGGKITSQNTYNGQPRAHLDGVNGVISLTSPIVKATSSGNRTYQQTIKIDAVNSRISANHSGDSFHENGEVYLDSEGILIDTTGVNTGRSISWSSGLVQSGLYVKLTDKNPNAGVNTLIAVYGEANSTSSNTGQVYGGYFIKLKSTGRFVGVNQIPSSSTSFFIQDYHEFLSGYNTNTCNVYLPDSTKGRFSGRKIYVKRINGGITVHGNGRSIVRTNQVSNVSLPDGECWVFIYDGTYWQAGRMYA